MKEMCRIGIDASSVREKFGGGKEQVLINLLEGLYNRGIAPVVYCQCGASAKVLEACPNAEIVNLESFLELRRGRTVRDILTRTFVLPRKVIRSKIDILLFPVPLTGFAKFACRTVVIPHDVQFKSNPSINRGIKFKIIGFLYGADFMLRDAIVSISNYDRKEIAKHYSAFDDKIRMINNPIKFGECSKFNVNREKQYIFSNNLMHSHKNLYILLEAFAEIKERGWKGKLVIAGRLYCKDKKTRLILERLMDSGCLELTGYVSNERMNELISGASLFVNPSSYEGFGMSAVEAMGMGTPCLLADNSAVREVTLGRASYYCPAEDARVLASAISRALENPQPIEFLADTAKMIKSRYDYKKVTEKYIDMFEELGRLNG